MTAQIDRQTTANHPRFVAIHKAIMHGSQSVAVAVSKTMAKRIANALNAHKINKEGV